MQVPGLNLLAQLQLGQPPAPIWYRFSAPCLRAGPTLADSLSHFTSIRFTLLHMGDVSADFRIMMAKSEYLTCWFRLFTIYVNVSPRLHIMYLLIALLPRKSSHRPQFMFQALTCFVALARSKQAASQNTLYFS